jgi:uncharacterized protein (TIGR00255 family)
MVNSMTGFGRCSNQSTEYTVTVEMKSVNHRFKELNIRMPKQMLILEDKIKKLLVPLINRGKVDLFIQLDGDLTKKKTVKANFELMDQFYQLATKIQKKYNIAENISLTHFFQHEEFLMIEENSFEDPKIEQEILKCVAVAANELCKMREVEGELLKIDLLEIINEIKQSILDIQIHAPKRLDDYRDRLVKKIAELMKDQIDESRILTEVTLYADKSDIHEESIRLESHILQFTSTLDQKEPIGRKLDFIIQEMNREVNTIGSKSNDSFLQTIVVELKTCLEKMREQVQNIE